MAQIDRERYIEFRISDDDGNAVTDRDLNALEVYLARDTVEVVNETVVLINWGDGRYYAKYTPTESGHDYLEIYDPLYDIRIIDAEFVEELPDESSSVDVSDVIILTQDFGGVGRFKIVDAEPQRFTLLVFRSFDWQAGRTHSAYAFTATEIDESGNWTTLEVPVLPDTYHMVARDESSGEVRVLAAFMKVELPGAS